MSRFSKWDTRVLTQKRVPLTFRNADAERERERGEGVSGVTWRTLERREGVVVVLEDWEHLLPGSHLGMLTFLLSD